MIRFAVPSMAIPFTSRSALAALALLAAASAVQAQRAPDAPAGVIQGIDYKYYQGSWNALPDFNALTPVKAGTASNCLLTLRNQEDNFGFRFTGYVDVPVDGNYTFYTRSDDGSKLWIGTTLVVNNDGLHGAAEQAGVISLKAGKHSITVDFFELGGDQVLDVSLAGPTLAKALIPDSRFFRTPPVTLRNPDAPAGVVAGLVYQYYQGTWDALPNFAALQPAKLGTLNNFLLTPRTQEDFFAFKYTGYIDVPTDGSYTFYTRSDDGSRFSIGSTVVVNNDGLHGSVEQAGTIGLKAGKHSFTAEFFEKGGDQVMEVSFAGPGLAKALVPDARLFYLPAATAMWNYRYYEGAWNALPDFNALTPAASGTTTSISVAPRLREDNFGLRFDANIAIPTAGAYTFYTNSDDGSRLWVGSTLVVDNDGLHGPQERSGVINLAAGTYAVGVAFFELGGGQVIDVSVSGPGLAKQTIPNSWIVSGNRPPNAPTITEPFQAGGMVNPEDFHMETAPFSDPDAASTHRCSDYEIWTVAPSERIWFTSCIGGIEKLHTHLGDGVFMGSHAGRTSLMGSTDYNFRTRHRDNSNDPATEWSPFSARAIRTNGAPVLPPPGAGSPWAMRQSGIQAEIAATGFRMPVNIAFVANPSVDPNSAFYYVSELYGNIKCVTRNGNVIAYASNLLNFTPTGAFPGSGEQGVGGLAVDPVSGDVFISMLYEFAGDATRHYPKLVRFHSNDAGLHAATQTTILDMAGETQGQSHMASNLSVGPDSKLYSHMGDGFDAARGQDMNSFRGKVLRLNLDGTAPNDNPYYNAADGITARDYIFAYGFRNPFGGGWRAADGAHYNIENGPSVDRLSKVLRGQNQLWDGSDASMRNFAIHNFDPAHGPVNLAFLQSASQGGSGFPAAKMDHLFVTESGPTYASGPQPLGKRITEFTLDAAGTKLTGPLNLIEYIGSGKATAVGLAAGPDGLYFTDLYKDLNATTPTDAGGNVYRIRYVGTGTGISAPWANHDVGAVGMAGCASFANGAFALTGSGGDIWDNADGFHFVHKAANGDVTITARVNSVQGTNAWAKAGVMIREDLTAGSRHVLGAVTAQNGVAIQWRNATGSISENVNLVGYAAPYWVRLSRVGNTFTVYRSPDNVSWFTVGSTTIALNAAVQVGLVVTAHDNAQLNTASFDNVTTVP